MSSGRLLNLTVFLCFKFSVYLISLVMGPTDLLPLFVQSWSRVHGWFRNSRCVHRFSHCSLIFQIDDLRVKVSPSLDQISIPSLSVVYWVVDQSSRVILHLHSVEILLFDGLWFQILCEVQVYVRGTGAGKVAGCAHRDDLCNGINFSSFGWTVALQK